MSKVYHTVAMLDPGGRQFILDPTCGTGGFLITAMNHVIDKIRIAETKDGVMLNVQKQPLRNEFSVLPAQILRG